MKRLLLIALAIVCCQAAFAAPALVQKGNAHPGSSATCAISLTGVAANDTLIFYAYMASAASFTSIADSSGNTVSAAESWVHNPTSPTVSYGMYYVQAASAGTHTITITFGSAGTVVCFMSEWSGLATTGVLDVAGTINFVATSATVTSNSITPTANGDLIIFAIGQSGASNTYSAWNNSFVQQDSYNASGPGGAWASEVQATAAAINGQVTSSGANNYAAGIAAFKAAGGSGCIRSGLQSIGSLTVPNGTTGLYRMKNGSSVTPDCSTGDYFQPTVGNFGVN